MSDRWHLTWRGRIGLTLIALALRLIRHPPRSRIAQASHVAGHWMNALGLRIVGPR